MTTFDDGIVREQDEAAKSSRRTISRAVKKKIKRAVEKQKLEKTQSTIGFPYMDLDAAVSVAQAMLAAGGVALTREQLAGVMGQAVTGGGFVTKLATARTFGLVALAQGKLELTQLGFNILENDDRRQRSARAEAFLAVPLYRRVYEDFRGKQLPPRPTGLEATFLRYGVAPKQTTNARLAFDKSARQAGFFSAGPERLIEPIIAGGNPPSDRGGPSVEEVEQVEERRQPTRGREPALELHPFVEGLLTTLPPPNTNWSIEGQGKWLQTAANIFSLLYNGGGKIDVTVTPDNDKSKAAP